MFENNGPAGQGFYADVSVGGGPSSQVLVDTGSTGLLVPASDVNLASLGTPTATNMTVAYGDPGSTILTETYNIYTTTVNFGNGIVTAPTSIGVITSASETTAGGVTTSVAGLPIMGVGADEPYQPGLPNPIQALPGNLGQGALIDDPLITSYNPSYTGVLQFGPNTLPSYASVTGAPVTTLDVSIDGGTPQAVTGVYIDSGGQLGAIPQNLLPSGTAGDLAPAGTTYAVYTTNGTELYTAPPSGYGADLPVVVSSQNSGGSLNSGIWPFLEDPVYLSYSPSGVGTIFFDT